MSKKKFPLEFRKLKDGNNTLFLVSFKEKGGNDYWEESTLASLEQLKELQSRINDLITSLSFSEKLEISTETAQKLELYFNTDEACIQCQHQKSDRCKACITQIGDSPLERILYNALIDNNLYYDFAPQQYLNHKGEKIYPQKTTDKNLPFDQAVLTVVDFFFERYKLCVYADGHYYHERTEEQATHDRNIDNKLQQLGYKTLRYTGKAIREDIDKITQEIISILNKKKSPAYTFKGYNPQ